MPHDSFIKDGKSRTNLDLQTLWLNNNAQMFLQKHNACSTKWVGVGMSLSATRLAKSLLRRKSAAVFKVRLFDERSIDRK